MSYRRRGYAEVRDNLLTALVGGVAAESHPYPPPGGGTAPYAHALEQPPVARIVSVHGRRNGVPYRFAEADDYELSGNGTLLQWIEGGALPDDGSLVLVNYMPEGARSGVDDVQVGSVARTLSESVALEMASLYAELEAVQDAGYLDSAAGSELERVVALLGITRVPGGRPSGELTFTRASGGRGVISIPAGTRVITADGDVAYETLETVSLLDGQQRIRVKARDLEPGDPLAADLLNVLPVPISGVVTVTNEKPTNEADEAESDAELRNRARNFLHGSERATIGALHEAIVSQGVQADIEDIDTPSFDLGVGSVRISLHGDTITPEQEQRVRSAVAQVRPAGVRIVWGTAIAPQTVDLELRLTTVTNLVASQLRGIHQAVTEAVTAYFKQLPVRSNGSVAKILNAALGVEGVEDARLVSALLDGATDVLDGDEGLISIENKSVILGDLRLVDPALATEVAVAVSVPAGSIADIPAYETALTTSLDNLVAWLNDQAESGAVSLSYGLLLHALDLPDQPAGPPSVPPPTLPTAADLGAVAVSLAITDGAGRSSLLADDTHSYELGSGERLTVQQVAVTEVT